MAGEDENSSKFTLDLDVAKFVEKAGAAQDAITAIGDSKNISSLVSGLGEVGALVGILGASLLAVKLTMDAVFRAEDIHATQAQFDYLTQKAGVYSETLKKGLIEASRGWVDETTLMESANRAMTELQGGVERLPELMDFARKVSAVMGGELLDNFDRITKAVAYGNTMQLRRIGIFIDEKKAIGDYAASVGLTVDVLSQADKQQAILNAVLEENKNKWAGVNTNIKQAQSLWAQFKTLVIELKDSVVLLVEGFFKFWGVLTLLNTVIPKLSQMFHSLNESIKEHLGIHKEASQEIIKNQEKVNKVHGDATLIAKKRAQDEKDLSRLKTEALREELKNTEDAERAEQLYGEIKRQEALETQAQIDAVIAKEKEHLITKQQATAELLELDRIEKEKLKRDEDELERARQQALDRYARNSENVFQGISRGAVAESNKSAAAVRNFANLGSTAFKTFSDHAATGLMAIGEGSKKTGDIMKQFMFGSLADIAEAEGRMLLASGLINPLNMAAGAALLVLAGVLRSQAGGASSDLGSGGGGGGGDYGAASTPQPASATAATTANNKSVNLIIQGHMLTDDRTARWIVDQVRAAADATDFKVQSIGGGL